MITELYKNLSFRTVSGGQQIEFEKVSDLTAHINFKMKHSILSNLDDQDLAAEKNNEDVKNTNEFFNKPSDQDNFEEWIIEDITNNEPYKHQKIEDPYVEPTVKDAVTIENETNKGIDDFLKVASEFNKLDAAATRQKKVYYYDKLFEDVQEIDNSRQKIDNAPKTEDIFVDDELFSDSNKKDVKTLVDVKNAETNVDDIFFDDEPIDTAPNVQPTPEPTLKFSNILFQKHNAKTKTSKKFFKSTKK